MGYNVISYANDELKVFFFKEKSEMKKAYEMNYKSLIIESENKLDFSRTKDFEGIEEIFCERNNDHKFLGFLAEEYFKEACVEASLIPTKIEQSKDSYDEMYKKILEIEYIKRPDYYILRKDCFVEVKARAIDDNDNFFKILKKEFDAYKAFQKHSNKKIYFAVYTIDENNKVLKDSLAMMFLDCLDIENENVSIYRSDRGIDWYNVKRPAFISGLKLLLNN
ncbi:MAG: hypothetical protein IJP90_09810 [Treponema sp.]|nr:hypothetical protein [Treponema sp.]MBR0099995.1 hypothetical protein [Treponema sp.]